MKFIDHRLVGSVRYNNVDNENKIKGKIASNIYHHHR